MDMDNKERPKPRGNIISMWKLKKKNYVVDAKNFSCMIYRCVCEFSTKSVLFFNFFKSTFKIF